MKTREKQQLKEFSYIGLTLLSLAIIIAAHVSIFGAAANPFNSLIIASNYLIISLISYISIRYDISTEILEEKEGSMKIELKYEKRW